jgi:hypothetical protein
MYVEFRWERIKVNILQGYDEFRWYKLDISLVQHIHDKSCEPIGCIAIYGILFKILVRF